ncbi:MAG: TldD/PmbA family protein [Zestosphaera sp.]
MTTDSIEIGRRVVEKLRSRFDDVAALLRTRDRVMVKLWNTEPSVTQNWLTTEVALLLTKSRRVVILEFSVGSPHEVLEAVENVSGVVERIEESELYAPLPEPPEVKPIEGMFDPNLVHVMSDPAPLAQKMIDAALSEGVDRVAGTLTLSRELRALVTSKGFEGSEERTYVETYLRAFKGEFSGHWAHGSSHINELEIKKVGMRAGMYATITKNRVDLQPGRYDVVLSPLVVGNLMNYVSLMSSALAVLMGYSIFVKYKPGERVASEKLTLVDAPRDPALPNATSFDDEGIPTFNKPIIEKGVFRNLLHNSGTASKLGARSTGNSGWLMPTAWNLHLEPGDLNEDELPNELRNGVIITNNWYTRLQNYVEGLFSTVARDATLLVKNGEVVGDVGRIRMATSFPMLLSNVDELTRQMYDIMWWEVRTPTKSPYVLVRNVELTKPYI